MTSHVGVPHIVVDYPQSESTTRTVESDIMARRLLTLAMNWQGPLNENDTFVINIPFMNYNVTISELTKSLKAMEGTADYPSVKFLMVDSSGAHVHFRWLQPRP